MALALSYSGASTWRECQQRYWYRYEDKLRPKIKSAPAPKLGSWLHSYLERYYKAVQRGVSTTGAHDFALSHTLKQYDQDLKDMVQVALMVGDEKLAQEFQDIESRGTDIAERYFLARGKDDAEKYEILLVEQHFNTPVDEDIRAPGVADLVVRDLDRGHLQMWDHKSTGNVPQPNTHILDMQEVLYAAMLHEQRGIQVDELVWNYLKTVPPTPPEVLKAGGLTKRKDLVSDQPTYMAAIIENNLLPEDYADVLQRLSGREQSVFFPRHVTTLIPEAEEVIIGDFARTGHEILRAKAEENFIAIRSVGRICIWCDYRKVCEAVVTGGDVEDIIERHFGGE